jgi:hypothetical protein
VEKPSMMWLIGGGVAGGLVLLLGVLVGTINWDKGGKKAVTGVPAGTPEVKETKGGLPPSTPEMKGTKDGAPAGTPEVKGTKDGAPAARWIYLSDLQEMDWSGHEAFGKNGSSKYAHITVNGIRYLKGLWTHPRDRGDCSVKYRLSGLDATTFVTKVAINDSAIPKLRSSLTFQVLGDGKALTTSVPMRAKGQVQECRISVKDVRVLELRVYCQGSFDSAHAVWLDPHLLLSSPNNADKPGK